MRGEKMQNGRFKKKELEIKDFGVLAATVVPQYNQSNEENSFNTTTKNKRAMMALYRSTG